jgi:hypothetical protein
MDKARRLTEAVTLRKILWYCPESNPESPVKFTAQKRKIHKN